MTLYFRPDVFDDGDALKSPLGPQQALHNVHVPGLRAWADPLFDELQRGRPHTQDAVDSLARLMLIHVSRHLSQAGDEKKALTKGSLARLRDYVESHLSEPILVADLARVAGLSINRLAWEFKAQTGQSPHQFVLALRVEQARQLLRGSTLPLAEVAAACGFASQQHLTHVMRRHMGVTPARFRRGSGSA